MGIAFQIEAPGILSGFPGIVDADAPGLGHRVWAAPVIQKIEGFPTQVQAVAVPGDGQSLAELPRS